MNWKSVFPGYLSKYKEKFIDDKENIDKVQKCF